MYLLTKCTTTLQYGGLKDLYNSQCFSLTIKMAVPMDI